MQVLARIGVFKKMKATISAHYFDAVLVGVWGRSKTSSVDETLDRLGESDLTSRVVVAGGNFLYVLGALRDLSELDGYVEFVKRAAEMPEPTVGIHTLNAGIHPDWADGGKRKESYKELSPLDLKIILSLRDDARKPIAEIADMIGVSAKTVRRHLDDMRSGGVMDFDEPWDPTSGEDMFTILLLNLKEGADRVKVGRRLLSKRPLNLIMMRSFSNLPNFLLGILSSDRMSEIREILREVAEDEDVLAVTPNLLYLERPYLTWDEKNPALLARRSEKVKKPRLRSGSNMR
jgi:predicted transcriptional regulator